MRVKVSLCASEGETPDMADPDTQMVSILWNHYLKTGLLSARIFDYINEDSVSAITDRAVVWKLIYSLPAKPFKVMSDFMTASEYCPTMATMSASNTTCCWQSWPKARC